ncbi:MULTISPECIES: plasmid mobilization relaxosome protein MobC [Pedobacter]|uniref:plasmid mobilization relaxosome protein MobC n=1 Tax=Pedobacter TaxID=84567 RepID=UPI001213445C|nr:plasmid mobilization relaxosome protein MobC [Pedobacter aquatilis]RZK65803.1 MAG: plasmid mobilization relaxosome protein MobC [Pedobacter sp.]
MEKASVLKKADLIRKKLLFEGQRILLDAKSLMGNLDLVGLELSRAGNNINQLARYANILNRDGRFQLFWLTGFCWNSANTIKSRWIWSD